MRCSPATCSRCCASCSARSPTTHAGAASADVYLLAGSEIILRRRVAAGERPDTLVVEEPLEIRVGVRPMSVYDANAPGSARQWEQALASPALSAVWKLCPQPQVLTALGLLMVKPPPMMAST